MTLGWNEDIKRELGACGSNVYIGHNVMIAKPEGVFLGDNVRIDPFTIISSSLVAEGNNQIGSHCIMNGRKTVRLGKWISFGYRVTVLTGSENATGDHGPIGDWFGKNESFEEDVVMHDYATIFSHNLVLPGAIIPTGAVVGANCVITRNTFLKPFYLHRPYDGEIVPYRERNEKAIRQAVEDWKNEE